jgi:hypothetical protein
MEAYVNNERNVSQGKDRLSGCRFSDYMLNHIPTLNNSAVEK